MHVVDNSLHLLTEKRKLVHIKFIFYYAVFLIKTLQMILLNMGDVSWLSDIHNEQ